MPLGAAPLGAFSIASPTPSLVASTTLVLTSGTTQTITRTVG
jgi:hypothetical protein